MNLEYLAEQKGKAEVQKILCELLESYLKPAFGALPKREIDLMFLDSLEALGAINKNPSLYEFVSKLKVTRSKARILYYDRELRRFDGKKLEIMALDALKRPILQKQGSLFVLEIENPLVSDHIRHMFQEIGYATDGSFSPSLIKVSVDAFVKLLESRLTEESQKAIKEALVRAGAPDRSFKGVVKAALGTLGKKIASDAGEAVAEHVADFIGPLWNTEYQNIYNSFYKLFTGDHKC